MYLYGSFYVRYNKFYVINIKCQRTYNIMTKISLIFSIKTRNEETIMFINYSPEVIRFFSDILNRDEEYIAVPVSQEYLL